MAAADMVKALVRVHGQGELRSILKDIPMRNSQGKVIPNHPVKVQAKTGTLNFVSALAGYMTTADGRDLAFAIFSADLPRREKVKRADGEAPQGGRAWTKRSRKLQLQLIERWGAAFNS